MDPPTDDDHLLRMLHLCSSSSSTQSDLKLQTLLHLLDCHVAPHIHPHLLSMISLNLFRCLPHVTAPDADEDQPFQDPSWPHLHLVYELLLRYLHSKIVEPLIDSSFVSKLVDLFDSQDPRERECLKTLLHRIYLTRTPLRPFLRKTITHVFYKFIFEASPQPHCGIGELLEILGSVINGFATPMKDEHIVLLERALIPLHKPEGFWVYHHQLAYCLIQFVDKDCRLAEVVIRGLLRYWPVTNCQKEILFLAELEEVLEAIRGEEFERLMVPLFRQLARCLTSSHFQVAQQALFLWNSEHFLDLISQNRNVLLPVIFDALEKNMRSHWNKGIHELTVNVQKIFQDMDSELFKECQEQYSQKVNWARISEEQRELRWKRIEAAAETAGADEMVLVN